MTFESLRDYMDALDKAGQLKRVRTKVSANLEVAEILRRAMYSQQQPAILFENVQGSSMPILGNAFGTMERLHLALDVKDFTEIGSRIVQLTKLKMPSSTLDKLKMLPKLSEIAEYGPKNVDSGPVVETVVTDKASLNSLPILKSFAGDAGKFITFGLTITKHPESGIRNIGVYRMQVVDERKAIMHWQIHKRAAEHYQLMKKSNKRIEVAVAIGADPATIFSAVAPVPEGLDKFLFSGITRKKGIKLVKCCTVDLEVPANAEVVLEGYVSPNDLLLEGPFGDHTGYYTPAELFPTFTLTAIMQRQDPIYMTTVVGKPILEDAYIGKVIERSFLPLIQMLQPEVVDPDIDVHNMREVLWAITTRADPKRDTMIIDNTPTDTLDPASPLPNLGSKMGIDATTKWRDEGYTREAQELAVVDDETRSLVNSRWKEYGFV